MHRRVHERHRIGRIGWLRAAVLGANDGLLSTASLVLGVAAAAGTHAAILIAAVAALVSGAMSMAAGEYVSVSSQHDTEMADLESSAVNCGSILPAKRRNSHKSMNTGASMTRPHTPSRAK